MLENFDPTTIQDEALRQVVMYLMNLVENLHATVSARLCTIWGKESGMKTFEVR